MKNSEAIQALFERYLSLLGIRRQKPSLEALKELVAAHMTRVPFENVSKLYYLRDQGLRDIPDFAQYIEGIERYNFGGTCYSNNYYLHLLLDHLGYDASLCGADMNEPDVHMVNMVSLSGREFLIDTGYAAPFLKPLPRDLTEDYTISLGRDRYVLKPRDKSGNSQIEFYHEGQLKHGYKAKPMDRTIEHFAQAIEESYYDTSTFMKALLLVRFYPNRSIRIHNLTIAISEGTTYDIRQLKDRDELMTMVEKHFSIPKEFVSKAIADMGEFGNVWT